MKVFPNLESAEAAAKAAAEAAAAAKAAKEGRPFVAEPFANSGCRAQGYYVAAAGADESEGFEEFSPEPEISGGYGWVVAIYPFFEAPNRTFL